MGINVCFNLEKYSVLIYLKGRVCYKCFGCLCVLVRSRQYLEPREYIFCRVICTFLTIDYGHKCVFGLRKI